SMIEIKCRAWDKEDKRMINDDQDFIAVIETNNGVLRLNPHHKENYWEFIDEERFDIMQYTGIKDRNGFEIYEGDIVRCYGGAYWNGIYEYNYVSEVRDIRDLNEIVHSEIVEILGNRYENPELLEVEGEMNEVCPTCNGSGGIDTFEESIGEVVTITCSDCGGSGVSDD